MDVFPDTARYHAGRRTTGSWALLLRLGLSELGVFASITAALSLVTSLVDRASSSPPIPPFDGWQVDVAAGVLAAAVLVVAVVSMAWARRFDRDPRLRLSYRLVAVVVALGPGLALGVLSGVPMSSALSWASERTDAAAAAHAWLASYQQAPPPMPSDEPVAPKAVADRLLHTSDLGAGWYDVTRPNQTVQQVPTPYAQQGITARAHSALTKDHWSGKAWILDELLMEHMDTFGSPAQAQEYARAAGQNTRGACGCPVALSPTTSETIDGATVWKRTSSTTSEPTVFAAFAEGRDVFVVSVTVQSNNLVLADEFTAVLSAAVRRARQATGKT